MSQAKVEKYKQEKYNRKKAPKKSKFKTYLAYAGATLAAVALIIYVGYSIALETNLIPEPTTAFVSNVTSEELASTLQSSGDVLGFYSKAVEEANAEAETEDTTEDTTTEAKETTAE